MSYRSIKRVLGESSLERKCRFLFGICLLLLITGSFWWYGNQTEQVVYQQNPARGRLLVDVFMLSIHMGSWERDENFKSLARNLTENLSKQDYQGRSLRYDVPDGDLQGPQTALDRKVMRMFLRDSELLGAESHNEQYGELLSDRDEYEYYRPIYAESGKCVACHHAMGRPAANGAPLLEGDLMAVIKVSIPNGLTQRAIDWNRAILISTAITTFFLAMVASYAIVRYVIVKPLRHLREVSDAVSHGNISLRAEIHTGDEFEALAVAFNRMLRHLVAVQEELRLANANLDAKVDELAQVNMRLYEMNTIKSDFLATMSHELRTPLNSILGFSEVLGSIDSLNDKQKRYVQNIQKSGRTLLEMINDILDLAKIESGKMEIRLVEFSIEQIVAAQCDMARPLTEKKNIDIEARVPPDLPPIIQDQARVQQILNNLLSNAIKFTPEGGRIVVSAARDDRDRLELQVSDTGVGIAEEDRAAIFEKFRQGRTGAPTGDAMTREYTGTGLGLSIVKELCKLLRGEVSVRSELGKGSVFTVLLPWVLTEPSRPEEPAIEGFDEFARIRFDYVRQRGSSAAGAE
jgi:two-component system, NarL family, sensor histidine kinase BarA